MASSFVTVIVKQLSVTLLLSSRVQTRLTAPQLTRAEAQRVFLRVQEALHHRPEIRRVSVR